MHTWILPRFGQMLLPLLLMDMILLAAPNQARSEAVTDMRSYCSVPPLPGFSIKPNLLLMIDNSASMFDPAYTDPGKYCLDDGAETFAKGAVSYLGYFDPASFYQYLSQTDASGREIGHFEQIAGTGLPQSSKCNVTDALPVTGVTEDVAKANLAIKAQVCVNISSGKLDNLIASGSFLNWLAASKLDVEKMALTGGKYDAVAGLLQGETRGCQGKRFIKMLGDAEVTFAVRGPVPAEPDYVYQASLGGMTRIEVYPKRYNKDACLAAVSAWQGGTLTDLKAQGDLCMGNTYTGAIPSKGVIYNEVMADCYAYLASSPRNPVLLQDHKLLNDCALRVRFVYGGNVASIPRNQGEDICGIGIYHKPISHGAVSYSNGYLGSCYNMWTLRYSDFICDWGQMQDFCAELEDPTLTDPSATALKPGTNANVPGFVLDGGLYNPGAVAGTVIARVAVASQPTGLIQEFSQAINFGAMVFTDNGAGAECSAASGIPCLKHCVNDPAPRMQCYQDSDCKTKTGCQEDAHSDGGRIISYVNHSPIGDHSSGSGLIAAIDGVAANSWTPLAEAFYDAIGYFSNRTSLRLQDGDFNAELPPSRFGCQKNNILVVTDGRSTADRARKVMDFVGAAVRDWVQGEAGMPASQTTTDAAAADPPFRGSYNLDDLAWIARNKNIFDPSQPVARDREYISTYVIYSGAPCSGGNCSGGDEGDPSTLMQLTATKGGGRMFSAQNPGELAASLRRMLHLIAAGSNSATDASLLATGDGNGALFLQEQFYRSKSFDGDETWATWIGEMQGLWYFIDPFIASSGDASAIREDTGGDKKLDLKRDRVVHYVFDPLLRQTRAKLSLDANGDGSVDEPQPEGYPILVSPEAVQSLWRAGLQLWDRGADQRTIYTQTDGRTLIGFTPTPTVASYLDLSREAAQKLLQAGSESEAKGIVSFVTGVDAAGTRERGVKMGGAEKKVWKLGDIVSSTPVLQTSVSLGTYHLAPPKGYGDPSYAKFVSGDPYQKNRGSVYVGANDGMLHAFKLGRLKLRPEEGESWASNRKAVLLGEGVGEESWAFIPRNALPYLRYLKEPQYPHLYYVDGASTIADVSIGNPAGCAAAQYRDCPKDDAAGSNWRTVLIGGMGLGGASRLPSDNCVEGAAGDCVKAPGENVGLSSYFALDVTDQTGAAIPPGFLWEFSHPGLGYATSGSAIVKINAQSGTPPKDDRTRNGRWFAVFASGPTGPIDPASCEFLGKSNQNLQLFVVELNATPPLARGSNYWVIDTGIKNAFGGSMSGAGIDTDRWDKNSGGHYEDNALYLGYTRQADDGSWDGGVLRVLTGEDPDPGQWRVSKVIEGVGPVTGGVAKLQDRGSHNLWLYFGTGRFLHNQDDPSAPRALFGVKEPCYSGKDVLADNGTCTLKPLLLGDLVDMTQVTEAKEKAVAQAAGWWIGLDGAAGTLASERSTTNPTPVTGGAVFFTSYKPSLDVCLSGVSYLWGVKYSTGGDVDSRLLGKALVPLSTGSSADVSFSKLSDRDSRRSQGMNGKPAGVKLITNSGLKPLKKIIHIQER